MKGDVVGATAASEGLSPDGRRTRWDAHRAARREDLLDAAVRVIARHGADAGMDLIAAAARTSKPVVYRYFADKTDLHRAVTERIVATVVTTLRDRAGDVPEDSAADDAQVARGRIAESVSAYLELLEQSPSLYRFVVEHPHLPDGTTFTEAIANLLAAQLAAPMRAGGLDPAYAHPWGEAIVGFISAASLWWLDHPGAMTREHLAGYLAALLWGGAAGVLAIGHAVDPRPADGLFPPG